MASDPPKGTGTSLVVSTPTSETPAGRRVMISSDDIRRVAASNQSNQVGAIAGGDVTGRDKITNNYYGGGSSASGIVESLMKRLADEIKTNQEVKHTIDTLQFFYVRKSPDNIRGLEAKLNFAKRSDELLYAFEKKRVVCEAIREMVALRISSRDFRLSVGKGRSHIQLYDSSKNKK